MSKPKRLVTLECFKETCRRLYRDCIMLVNDPGISHSTRSAIVQQLGKNATYTGRYADVWTKEALMTLLTAHNLLTGELGHE